MGASTPSNTYSETMLVFAIYRPANGRGYDNFIWKLYFKNAVMTDLAMDDASRAFQDMVNAAFNGKTAVSDDDRIIRKFQRRMESRDGILIVAAKTLTNAL